MNTIYYNGMETEHFKINKKGIELCREQIAKACETEAGCKKVATAMSGLRIETVEEALRYLFCKEGAFSG